MLAVYLCLLVCASSVLTQKVKVKDLPKNFPHCPRDENLDTCWIKAANQVRPFLRKGVPELNFPPLEPLIIPEVSLNQGTDALKINAKVKNIKVTGLSNYNFTHFHFDLKALEFFCSADIPSLHLDGDYTVTGKILIAPIEGAGKFTADVGKTQFTVFQRVREMEKNGEIYLEPTNTTTSIKVGDPKVHLDGLFGGNDELNNLTNRIIADNIDVLFEELKPVLEEVIGHIAEDLLFKALEGNVPFNRLYPIPK